MKRTLLAVYIGITMLLTPYTASAKLCGDLFSNSFEEKRAIKNILEQWEPILAFWPEYKEVVDGLFKNFDINRNIALAELALEHGLTVTQMNVLSRVHAEAFFKSHGLSLPDGYGHYTSAHLLALTRELATVFSLHESDLLIRLGLAGYKSDEEMRREYELYANYYKVGGLPPYKPPREWSASEKQQYERQKLYFQHLNGQDNLGRNIRRR